MNDSNEIKVGSYTGTGTGGSAADLDLEIGFDPSYIEFINEHGVTLAKWFGSLSAGELFLNNAFVNCALTDTGAAIGTTVENVANGAFMVAADGETVAVDAVAAGTAPTATTVPQNKWGAFGFEVGVDGTVDSGWDAANNNAGYNTEALAIAGVEAAAASAAHTACFYATVMSVNAGGFVGATTAFNDSDVTAYYYTYAPNKITSTGVTLLNESGSVRGIKIGQNAWINQTGVTYYYKAVR